MAHAAEIVLVVLVIGAGWYVHVRLFPWRDCPRCGGRKRISGGRGTHRDCGRCGNTGRVRRIGAGKD